MTHEGRVAVVTGAAAGIGRATALGLARRGATVVGVDLNEASETGEIVQAAGGKWLGLKADVSSPTDVAAAADAAIAAFDKVDILVNNAGIFPKHSFDELTFEEWKRVLSINLDSQFLMSKAFASSMKAGGWGRIVNLTSGSVQIAADNFSAYKASKMGTIGLTRGMAADLGRFGINVNAVSPSLTRTEGVVSYGANDMLDAVANIQAIKRVSVPEDIVGLILFLTGEDSHFVTGQTILADGGFTYM
ncbi:MAG: SDR family NAD(P)-dependent oxidoreductase [Sphingobium sp.]